MKKIAITVFCLALSAGVLKAQEKKQDSLKTTEKQEKIGKFHFDEETHDFGEVPEGPLAECDFVFKNTGKKPIVISDAHGSCGCTVPTWPKEPILPKHKAKIHVSYNTNGRTGPINKDVIITSNAEQSHMVLHITGAVKPKVENVNQNNSN